MDRFLKAGAGLVLTRDKPRRVLFVDFVDRVDIRKKVSHMASITNLEQLKNYFHYSLQSLRKIPFYTDDYELELEGAFDKRLEEITELLLAQAQKQMELQDDFSEIHSVYQDLAERALDIGFTDEQRNKLRDVYELRKDDLKRLKLEEINAFLATMQDAQELQDYWDSIKWYLQNNRPFLGKEFETMIARKFDEAMVSLSAR
jgi:predicted nuclease with TOPRIM domain